LRWGESDWLQRVWNPAPPDLWFKIWVTFHKEGFMLQWWCNKEMQHTVTWIFLLVSTYFRRLQILAFSVQVLQDKDVGAELKGNCKVVHSESWNADSNLSTWGIGCRRFPSRTDRSISDATWNNQCYCCDRHCPFLWWVHRFETWRSSLLRLLRSPVRLSRLLIDPLGKVINVFFSCSVNYPEVYFCRLWTFHSTSPSPCSLWWKQMITRGVARILKEGVVFKDFSQKRARSHTRRPWWCPW
jgi:hypothetical protein